MEGEHMDTKEALIKQVQSEFERLGTTRYEIFDTKRSSELPCARTVTKRLGLKNWSEVVATWGYDVTYQQWDKDIIADLIREVHSIHNDVSLRLLEKHGLRDKVLTSYFNSLPDACRYAGVEYFRQKRQDTPETDDELLQMYISFSEKLGRPARTRDLNNTNEIYGFEVFRSRFGSLEELQRRAGYEPEPHHRSISKERCLAVMAEIYTKHGRVPYEKLNELLPFAIRTLLRKFSTTRIDVVWNEVAAYCEKSDESIG